MDTQEIPSSSKRPTRVSAKKIDGSTWAACGDYIKHLYLDQGKTLEQVRETLENDLGFKATKAQYRHMIYEVWKLKKRLTREDVDFINAEKGKRKREGKETVVKVAGRIIHEDELKQKKPRYMSELERHQQRLANHDNIQGYTPVDIEIVTPSPRMSRATAIDDSTSFDPAGNILFMPSMLDSLTQSTTSVMHSPSAAEGLPPPTPRSSLLRIAPTMRFEIIFEAQLSLFLGDPASYFFAGIQDSSISLILSPEPEPITNPEIWVAKVLPSNKGQSLRLLDLMRFLKSYMIRVSNKIDDSFQQRQCMDSLLRSGRLKEHAGALERILKQRKPSEMIPRLDSSSGHIAEGDPEVFGLVVKSFAVELFYSAARTGDIDMLKLLVRLGILEAPGDDTFESETIGATAAQYAIEYKQQVAWSFILRQNINVNIAPISTLSPSLLWTAVLVDNPTLVSDLIECGAEDCFRDSAIGSSIFSRYLKQLGDDGLAWAQNLRIYTFSTTIGTALQLSVATSHLNCFRVLASKHSQKDRRFSDTIGSRDNILHIATERRDHSMIKEILSQPIYRGRVDEVAFRIKSDGKDPYIYTALACAIKNEDTKAIRILLEHGADPRNVALDYFESISVDLEYIFRSRSRDIRAPLKERLETQGLLPIVNRIEELILQKKKQEAWGDLFFDSSDEEVEDYNITWSYTFPSSGFAHDLLPTVDKLTNELLGDEFDEEIMIFLTLLELTLGFFANVDVDVRASRGVGGTLTSVEFEGMLFNHQDIKPLLSKLREVFDGLWAEASFSYVANTRSIKFELPPHTIPHSKETRTSVETTTKSYGSIPKHAAMDPLTRKLYAFCFEVKGGNYRTADYSYKCNNRKTTKLLLNLDKHFTKYKGLLQDIMNWSRCIPDKSFHRRLCDIAASHIMELDYYQLACLLKLAVYGDIYETVEQILSHQPSLVIPNDVIREATCFSSVKTFTCIFDRCVTGPSVSVRLEIPLLLAIILGNLYKVTKILPNVDVNYTFAFDTTAIEVAVVLGRLDITTALVEAGASKHLDEARELAYSKGYFTLHKIITRAIESRANGGPKPAGTGTAMNFLPQTSAQRNPVIPTAEHEAEDNEDGASILEELMTWDEPGSISHSLPCS
ncbi:hypothetical protein TWF730_010685 [Orbilia blumenaviensis]|uniref:Clr5 domain-containing protein n=1 Tax=Orbilia blumenaviensis TaxID=1796055 RepID=A0AAV9UQ70_9PEZI